MKLGSGDVEREEIPVVEIPAPAEMTVQPTALRHRGAGFLDRVSSSAQPSDRSPGSPPGAERLDVSDSARAVKRPAHGIGIVTYMSATTTLDDYASRIRRVLEHVQSHLAHAITPAGLAEIACFSPLHFQRVFRAMVGESVLGHARRLRLERAAWKLKFSDAPVTALAWGGEFAVARHVGPYQQSGKTYDRLIGHWLPLAGREPGEPPCIEQYWNNPEDTPAEKLETDVVQKLHVGPYEDEPETVAEMRAFAEQQGLAFAGRHHEIYLSDPRRVEPARLRTILRMPVR